MANTIQSGRGRIFIAPLDTDSIQSGPLRYVGFSKEGATIKFAIEEQKVKESDTGLDGTIAQMTTGYEPTFEFAMQEWTKENLAFALWSNVTTITSGTVADEELDTGLVVLDVVKTDKPKISSVVIIDDAGTPATLVANTDYIVTDSENGMITFLNVTGFTQPFHIAYSYGTSYQIPFGVAPDREHTIVFAGLNKANQLTGFGFELYRVKFKPIEEAMAKSFEFADLKVMGTGLADPNKINDNVLGRYGRWWI